MTWIVYPDLEVTSPNGYYRAEALAPHNGKISPKGEPLDPPEPSIWQSSFRYRLVDRQGSVVWERWQSFSNDPSPGGLYLSDEGWLVIRTLELGISHLVAISPAGKETIRLAIAASEQPALDDVSGRGPTVFVSNASETTGGMLWAQGSLSVYVTHEAESYFSVLLSSGRRFAINLSRGELVSGPSKELSKSIEAEEERFTEQRLRSSDPLADISEFLGVLGLVHRRRIFRLIPLVQELWSRDEFRIGCATASSALPGLYQIAREPRPTLCLVLAASRALLPGAACYSFRPDFESSDLPTAGGDNHRSENFFRLNPGFNSELVLKLLGCPDHIQEIGEKHPSRSGYHQGAQWDFYIHPDEVIRIHWEPGSGGQRMRSFQRIPLTREIIEERLQLLLDGTGGFYGYEDIVPLPQSELLEILGQVVEAMDNGSEG